MKILIRGNFKMDYKLRDAIPLYHAAQQLMEEWLIDYCDVTFMPFPTETYNMTKHNYAKLNDITLIPDEEKKIVRIKGVLGTLKQDDFAVREAIADFMDEWKITEMFLCWSRSELDKNFNNKKDVKIGQIEL